MKILLVLAHPKPSSFNHAIAETALLALQEDGHEVLRHDLYAERFNPVLSAEEMAPDAVLDEQTARHCTDLRQADGIILVHPSWWNQPPAILKGWVDRVFRAGVAFRFSPEGPSAGLPECLLNIENTLVFNTGDAPPERRRVYGDPLEVIWNANILSFCGIHHIERRLFAPVTASSPEQRQAWLQEVRELVKLTFPPSWRWAEITPGRRP